MSTALPDPVGVISRQAKRVRIVDIARQANVSRATASKVLLGTGGANTRVGKETARRVREVAAQFDYRPSLAAQTLAGKRTRVIGVVVDVAAGSSATRQLQAIDRMCTQRGFRLLVGYVHNNLGKISEFADDFYGREVEGVLCMAHHYPQFGDRVVKLFERFPNCVFMPAPIVDADVSYVSVDFRQLSYLAASHLLRQGRRRIVMIRRKGRPQHIRTQQWDDGFMAAYGEIGRPCNKSDQFVFADRSLIDRPRITRQCVDEILDRGADGVITTNETSAMWLMGELRRRGVRVPDDVALVSCQREPIGWASDVRLTSIDRRDTKIARLAIRCLLDHIELPADAPRPREHFVVAPRLVVGESCGASTPSPLPAKDRT